MPLPDAFEAPAGTAARGFAVIDPGESGQSGHIQATGIDAAGRKQYLYHRAWRTARDEEKFEHVRAAARRLPKIRDRLRADLTGGRGLTRERVLAAIVSLLDIGMFRVGGSEYAARKAAPRSACPR